MPARQSNPYGGDTPGDEVPTGSRTAGGQQPSGPIGVPYYVTDPNTGLPQEADPSGRYVTKDDNGKNIYADTGEPFHGQTHKVRWSAQVDTIDTLDESRSGGPFHVGQRSLPTTTTTQSVAPRYFSGEEWRPGSLQSDDMIALQKYMVSVGVIKPGVGQFGVWDKTWADAYQKVLGFANSAGLDVQTALTRWGDMGAAEGEQRAPLVKQLTNPDDLRKAFHDTIVNTLGQGWTQDRIERMVQNYQAEEAAAQQQNYDIEPTGGTVTAPPSPAAFAEAQARQEDPKSAVAHTGLSYEKKFFDMLGGVV